MEVREDISGGEGAEGAGADARGVEDDDFWYWRDGVQGRLQGREVGQVDGVGVDFEIGGGVGGGLDESRRGGEGGGGAGKEMDGGEALGGEVAGGVGADASTGADEQEGFGHCWRWSLVVGDGFGFCVYKIER